MSAIPSHLARVPNSLASMVTLGNLTRTNSQLLETQIQFATGRSLNRPSDNPIAASTVTVLQDGMERRQQRMRNLDHAQSLMDTADHLMGSMNELLLEAKGIASSMIGPTIDAETRRNHAEIIDSLLYEMHELSNREVDGVHLFGGDRSGARPFEELLGGYRYAGGREGMYLDLGTLSRLPVTMTGEEAFGALSARIEGDQDLDPTLLVDSRISALNGARGLGVSLGVVELDVASIGSFEVDLSEAESVGDVIDTLTQAINDFEAQNSIVVLDPGGITIDAGGDAFFVDVAPGVTLTINDLSGGVTAADLGLTNAAFTDANAVGEDLDPRVTMMTDLSDLAIVTPLTDFIVENGGQTRTIAASTATTVGDLAERVRQAGIGARLEISEDGTRLNLINEVSGADLAVYDLGGGTTADDLGLRSFRSSTQLSDFNFGEGVEILSGYVDPVTGLPDPSKDLDFRITLSDGSQFDVDLAGAETVADVVSMIQAVAPPTFTIGLRTDGNGFLLTDLSGGSGTFEVTALNGSHAAEDLGILVDATGATLAGEDRAKVRVASVFTHLMQLRDALRDNDERGITLAGEKLESEVSRLAQARAVLGQRANRVDSARERENEEQILDESLQSQLRDLDFAEASIRFSQLQMQIQAALTVGAESRALSLIDFLR